jgi:hypothetical protein
LSDLFLDLRNLKCGAQGVKEVSLEDLWLVGG